MSKGMKRAVRLAQAYSRDECLPELRRRIIAQVKSWRREDRDTFAALLFALMAAKTW